MQTVNPPDSKPAGSILQRLRGAHEAELFGPRGRVPRRGEPDASHHTALLVLGGLIIVGLALRLAVPRGIWVDEAISIHQARLSLHDLFRNLYYGDRQPPLYHLTLWLTIRVFGHSAFAVRLPSLIAGTLLIPVLYELGRELYDYFGLLLILVQQLTFVGVIVHRRRAGENTRALALGFSALAGVAIVLVGLLIVASVFDHSLFEVRNFLVLVPLVLLLLARLTTGWIRNSRVRLLAAGRPDRGRAYRPQASSSLVVSMIRPSATQAAP